jgi:hypothetical protein
MLQPNFRALTGTELRQLGCCSHQEVWNTARRVGMDETAMRACLPTAMSQALETGGDEVMQPAESSPQADRPTPAGECARMHPLGWVVWR